MEATEAREFWSGVFGDHTYEALPGKVKDELHDYLLVMREVAKVYDEVTLGRFTKPNTDSMWIIGRVNERLDEAWQEGYDAGKRGE